MQVTIRPATEDDLAAIVDVERAADARFAMVALEAVLNAPQTQAEDHAPAQAAGRLLVALDVTDVVVGFIRVDRVDGQPHVEQVSVTPRAAGHRVGARLMEAAERWAADRGYWSMTLCTYRDVAWNGPYYERLGWAPLKDEALGPDLRALRRREHDLGLDVQPRLAMVKSLAPTHGELGVRA